MARNTKKNPLAGGGKESLPSIPTLGGDASKKRQITVWPEFSETDVLNEKWEIVVKGGKVEKSVKTTAAPTPPQNFFDDPEGKCELPCCLKVASWKRPKDFLLDKIPVIVDMRQGINHFDLVSSNDAVHQSELMRWITSQILALWQQSEIIKAPSGNQVPPVPSTPDPNNIQESIYTHRWRPWEHIYALTKPLKGPNWPLYNPFGKYVVKLYWMGCWRKLIIDDLMPFDENDQLLLPSTTQSHELWPMLLTKALLKVAALDSGSGRTSSEFGDFSPIHCLKGWLPEIISLEYEYLEKTWNFLKATLPEFKLPELPPKEEGKPVETGDQLKDSCSALFPKDPKPEKEPEKPPEKPEVKAGGKPQRGAKPKKKETAEKEDKEKLKDKAVVQVEEHHAPEHPEFMVFVSYHGLPKQPTKVTMLSEMADASERLRQHGLSHSYPHPVLLTQTRSCPLESPPPPVKVAAWKEVRYMKKKNPTLISAEPIEPVSEKPIQSLHLVSPFLNKNVTPLEIPQDTHRQKSTLEFLQMCLQGMSPIAENEAVDGAEPKNEQENKLPTVKEPVKSAEEIQKPPETAAPKTDKTDVKGKKSRTDAPKDLSPTEPVTPPATPKSQEKRLLSSKQSKRANERSSSATKSVLEDGASTSNVDQTKGKESPKIVIPEAPIQDPIPTDVKTDFWMDFDVLYKCFKTLYIYHKPATYTFNYPDSKNPVQVTPAVERVDKAKGEKKPAAGAGSLAVPPIEDKSHGNSFLFVDSLQPIEIVVSFSAISHWNDAIPISKEDSKSGSQVAGPTQASKSGKESRIGDSSVTSEASFGAEQAQAQTVGAPKGPLQPGVISAEAYSWKRVVASDTKLRIRTTGTRATLLSLPPGRHVLRFLITSPLGHHVQLCSTTNFIFGDEEKVMSELTKESCRFTDNAIKGLLSLGRCIQTFSDPVKHDIAKHEYAACNCLFKKAMSTPTMLEHHKAYLEALYTMLKSVFSSSPEATQLLSPEMTFAWRVFCFDCTTVNPLGLQSSSATSRPATAVTNNDRAPSTGATLKKNAAKKPMAPIVQATTELDPVANKVEFWKNKEITSEEHEAAEDIQRVWRGYYVRKVKNSLTPGTEDNVKVQEQLMKVWNYIEQNSLESSALLLFRTMFKVNPALMNKYSFSDDEWNKIAYVDYSGIFPEHGPNLWFLLCREVFHVSEETLCVPKLSSTAPFCLLRVVDNDTGKEIPQVFLKVAPYVYKKNTNGYTFMVEALTNNDPLPSGRWRMRLIGSHHPLPAPVRKEINTSFNVQELRDYYLPTNNSVIFRFSVRVVDDLLVTLQMSTSKPDVYVRLQIFDQDEEIAGVEGKGGAVIPAFIFRKANALVSSPHGEGQRSRSSSRSSMKGTKMSAGSLQTKPSVPKNTSSLHRSSRSSKPMTDSANYLDNMSEQSHKYVIQAVVLRNSWALSSTQLAFVQSIKDNEKNETINAAEQSSLPRSESVPATKKTSSKSKTGKDKEKEKSIVSLFDTTRPHWTLRIVTDANSADAIEVRKDTEHLDSIKAMKKAWEVAEPGRAAKAKQSRLQYLSTHLVKVDSPADEEDREEPPVDDISSSGGEPHQKTKKQLEIVPPLDLTPWIRQTTDEPRDLVDVMAEREMKRKLEIEEFQAKRKEVEEWRERDRQWRNKEKVKQMDLFEKRQAERDDYRAKLLEAREAFRQQFLEKERILQEELAAKEAALLAENKKSSPRQRKSKSPTGKKATKA